MNRISKQEFLLEADRLRDSETGGRIPAAFACTPEFFERFSGTALSAIPPEGPESSEATVSMQFVVTPCVNNLLVFDRSRYDEVRAALDVLGALKDQGRLRISSLGVHE